MNLPKKIDEFYSEPTKPYMQTEVIAETTASKKPNFLKRKVYYTHYEPTKYIYFSKKKDSKYYNIAVVCNKNNTIYIGIYNPMTGIVKFYPIDKDIFSRFTYPSDFIDLIYLYYPYINNRYNNPITLNINITAIIKVLEFYSEYISSKIKDTDINSFIELLKKLQIERKKQNNNVKKKTKTSTTTGSGTGTGKNTTNSVGIYK